MTPAEAIDILQREELCRRVQRPCNLYCGTCPYYVKHKDYMEAYHTAISALCKLDKK